MYAPTFLTITIILEFLHGFMVLLGRLPVNCLIKGMDIQIIAEITDLPIERIELLKSAVQKENARQKS